GVLGCDRSSCSERMHPSALSLEISRPTILAFCGILRLPSLLVRALTPMQLFGLRKAPDLSLALPQVLPREDTGSGPATGGCLLQPPVCVVSTVFLTQGRGPRPQGRGRVRDSAPYSNLSARGKPAGGRRPAWAA